MAWLRLLRGRKKEAPDLEALLEGTEMDPLERKYPPHDRRDQERHEEDGDFCASLWYVDIS